MSSTSRMSSARSSTTRIVFGMMSVDATAATTGFTFKDTFNSLIVGGKGPLLQYFPRMCPHSRKLWAWLTLRRSFFDDVDVLRQGLGIVVLVPGDPMIGLDGWHKGAKYHAGMRQLPNFAAGQRDAQPLGDDVHQRRFQIGVLNNPGREAPGLARRNQPVSEAGVRALGHADEEFVL